MVAKQDFKPPKKLICEVCNKEEAVGVASCGMLQAVSHAYGANCINENADPLWCVIAVHDILAGDINLFLLDHMNTYMDGVYMTVRDAIAKYEGKENGDS